MSSLAVKIAAPSDGGFELPVTSNHAGDFLSTRESKMDIKLKILIPCLLIVTGCTSPAAQMGPHQLSQLSNQQLCELKNNYPWEQKTEIEIGKRNLNCDPAYNECLLRGTKAGTPEMAMCINQIRENWALQAELEKQKQQMQQQQIQYENQRRLDMLRNRSQPQPTYYFR